MEKKKIAFISEHASPLATLGGVDSGGQNVYVAELAKHLAAQGHEIDIFTRWDNPSTEQLVHWLPGIRVIHIKAGPVADLPKEEILPFMAEFRKRMIKFMNENNTYYDLIHAHFFMSALVAMELKERIGIPFVVTFHALGHVRKLHQGDNDKFPRVRTDIEEEVVKKADLIIAECPQDEEDLIQLYNASPDRITIIPCGFNTKEFYPVNKILARNLLGLEHNEKVLLQLGRMVPRKGVDNVIRAMAKIKLQNQKVRLVIVGGDTEDPEFSNCTELARLKEIAQSEGVLDQITFAGRKKRNKLKYYYSAADIFITTPWYEPFGITPLESMACGTPVIGANVGGIKFSVADGETGFLVPANDPEALAEKAAILLGDEALLNSMKQKSKERVNTLFTWSGVAKSMEKAYETVLVRQLNAANEVLLKRKAA